MLTTAITQPPFTYIMFSFLLFILTHENFILASFYALYIYVRAFLFGGLVSTFDWF